MGIVRRPSHQKKLSIIPKLIETIFTVKMMKRMLMFICLIASIRSTFCMNEMNEMKQRNDPDWTEPVECKPSEHCCLKVQLVDAPNVAQIEYRWAHGHSVECEKRSFHRTSYFLCPMISLQNRITITLIFYFQFL